MNVQAIMSKLKKIIVVVKNKNQDKTEKNPGAAAGD
jgi:hypothetical protein